MEKARNKLKILLMQIRKDRQVAAEELTSFARHANLDDAQFDILNVFKTPYFDHSILKGYDALWVGGASEANVLYPQKYPFIDSAKKLLSRCCDIDFPVFASCFGFQLAVLALGGEVVDTFDDDFEMGTIPINIAVQGQKDLLIRDIENPFLAVSVHKQKVLKLPENCELLAETNVCVHAFKVKGKPFWAFQFHPEVDRDILVERLTIYKQKYTQNDAQLDQVLAHAVETPDANALMNKFVDRVLLGRG